MTKKSNSRILRDEASAPKDLRSAEYINTTGIRVTLIGVPPMLIPAIADSIEFPSKPTYTVTLATGDAQIFEHDEKSLTTDEDKKAWADYKAKNNEAEDTLSRRMLKAVLLEGVIINAEMPELLKWKKRQELIGIKLSDDEDELALQYKEIAVARSKDDIENIMSMVMELTGVDREALDLAKSSFQDSMESGS
jgi:hypothetical protein